MPKISRLILQVPREFRCLAHVKNKSRDFAELLGTGGADSSFRRDHVAVNFLIYGTTAFIFLRLWGGDGKCRLAAIYAGRTLDDVNTKTSRFVW